MWRGDGCVRWTQSAKDGPTRGNNHGALFQVEVNLFLFHSTVSHNSHHAHQGHLTEHMYLNGPLDMGYVVCIYTSFFLSFKLPHCLCWGWLELYGHCWCHKCPSECWQSSTVTGCPRLHKSPPAYSAKVVSQRHTNFSFVSHFIKAMQHFWELLLYVILLLIAPTNAMHRKSLRLVDYSNRQPWKDTWA